MQCLPPTVGKNEDIVRRRKVVTVYFSRVMATVRHAEFHDMGKPCEELLQEVGGRRFTITPKPRKVVEYPRWISTRQDNVYDKQRHQSRSHGELGIAG